MAKIGHPPWRLESRRGRSLPIQVVLAPYFGITPYILKTSFRLSLRVMMMPALIRSHS